MKHAFGSMQWMLYIVAGSLVTPLSVAYAFHLPPQEVADLLQRTFFIIGLSSILQAFFGHRLPILEGPAGIWWSVFLVYAGISADAISRVASLRELEMALIMSGILFFIISVYKIMDKIKPLFSSLVLGTYLLLLVFQLSGSFVRGVLGIGYRINRVDFPIAGAAILIVVVSIWLGRNRHPILRTYSILLSLLFGWLLFFFLGFEKPMAPVEEAVSLPQLFAWGTPIFESSAILTSVVITMLLMVNLIASIKVVENAVGREPKEVYNSAAFMTGLNQLLAGAFSSIGCISNAHSAGFVNTTNMRSRIPFIIGSAGVMIVAFLPIISQLIATLPAPVGYAIVFVPFSSLLASGFRELKDQIMVEGKLFVLTFALMVGVGTMSIPATALQGVPAFLLPLFSNGLVMGVITCIVMEQLINRLDKSKEETGTR